MKIFEKALELKGQKFGIVTLVATRGHAPQDVAAKALINSSGLLCGTIGGGKVEAKAIRFVQDELKKDIPKKIWSEKWNLQRDVGMTCGGEVEFLFEIFTPPRLQIFLFGAGHISQALSRILLPMDLSLTVLDTRAEWIQQLPPESTQLKKVLCPSMETWAQEQELPQSAFYLLITQGHSVDWPVLVALLKKWPSPPAYFGVIGSEVKSLKIRNELRAEAFPEETISKLHCPLGLKCNSNDPQEIAVSIAAEILQMKSKFI